jgi:hypothetical protein
MDEIQQHDMFLLPRSLHCILQGCYIMAEWFQTGQYMLKFCLSLVHHTVYIVYCTFLTIDRHNVSYCPSDSFFHQIYRGKNIY